MSSAVPHHLDSLSHYSRRQSGANLIVAFICGGALGAAGALSIARMTSDRDLELVRVVRDLAADSFVEEVDESTLVDDALSGMIDSLDRYSRYYRPEEIEALDRTTRGEFRGVGVVFRAPTTDGQILFAAPGGPADRAGVQVGDTIVSIDGDPVAEMPPGGIQERLRTPDAGGLQVELRDLAGELRTASIHPEPVLDPSIRLARMVDVENGIAHIGLVSFSSRSLEEFDAAVEQLELGGLNGLVLDLRGNGGGSLDAAVALANRFVAEGRLVATRTRERTQVVKAKPQEAYHLGLPLVLLVDRDSASASEVLAGALQDHGAATLVGEPTYGKGTVQTLTRFSGDRAIVKVTTAHYLTPAWRLIERDEDDPQRTGIAPEVYVPIDDAQRRAVLGYIQNYHPPAMLVPQIRAWEEDSGLELLPTPPEDPQLDAALALLRGEGPGDARVATSDG